MKNKKIEVLSPATIANIGCGFDVLGLALHQPCDKLEVRLNSSKKITLHNETSVSLPLSPEKNVASFALQNLLNELKIEQGFDIIFKEKIRLGSGIGSSSASAAGAVVAANELLGNPFSHKELVKFAMQGEKVASGTAHADNVAPAILGGLTLVRSYKPLDIISIPYPENLFCVVVHPELEIKTSEAREILPKKIPLKNAIEQWGNLAGLISGFFQKDFELISRSLTDVIIEPVRSSLIPNYNLVKEKALENGALACSISGSGPSIFAFCKDEKSAQKIGENMQAVFLNKNVNCDLFISKINPYGVTLSVI